MGVFFSIRFLAKRRLLSYVSILYPKNAVLSQTNSIQCLFHAEFLETSDSIVVSGRSLWDLRGMHCKILSCEHYRLPTRTCNIFAKKYYPKLKKTGKMKKNLKRFEDELRAEMSKNAAVRTKRRLSRARLNSLVSVKRPVETKSVKKVLFSTSPPQYQTNFPSPLTLDEKMDFRG